jgi:hypothetical protein
VQSIGTPGYTPAEPLKSGANYVAVVTPGNKWDLEGITCGRCHNATVPTVTAAQIAASSFTSTTPTSSGMGNLADGVGRNNLCFGCHQSIGKDWPAGTTTTDPTKIPVGVSHGAAYGRDFNGHVLGNSFLNSPHAKYTGTIKLNSLGKYDLFDSNPSDANTQLEYASVFKGYTCWQGSASNSPAKTKADGSEITTKADCEGIYGANAWKPTSSSWPGTDYSDIQGNCTTCHDVHNSLFVASQSEAALRKTCETCHVNNATTFATDAAAPQVQDPGVLGNHPTGPGTPFDATMFESSCVVCHMATQAEANGDQNSMPVHVWRINTDVNYNTFPTTGQFYGGTCSVHAGAVANAPYLPVVYASDTSSANCTANSGVWTAQAKNQNATAAADGAYANAVWVDLDFACGQCHGGSFGNTKIHNGAPYYTKAQLAPLAAGMHSGAAAITLPAAPTTVCTLTPSTGTVGVTSFGLTGANTGDPSSQVYVNWGDGSAMQIGALAGTFNKVYANTGNYKITKVVKDAFGQSATCTASATVGSATTGAATGTYTVTTSPAMQNVNVYLKNAATHMSFTGATSAAGTLTLPKMANSMPAGNYSMYVYAPNGKTCYTDAGHTTPFVNGTSVATGGSTTLYCQ